MADRDNYILSMNMTGFFKREIQMYALGDIKFKKPISLKQVAYVLGFLIIWTLPLLLVFGIILNPLYFGILLVPPIALGVFAVKPIFGGKTLIDFTKTAFRFLKEPKAWADFKPFTPKEEFQINSEIWISRRKEHQMLADMIEQEQ